MSAEAHPVCDRSTTTVYLPTNPSLSEAPYSAFTNARAASCGESAPHTALITAT